MGIIKFGEKKFTKGDVIEAYKLGKDAISGHRLFEISMENRTRGHR